MGLKKKGYKTRIIDNQIKTYLRIFSAVCIEGPKYCGKTRSALNYSNSEIYISDPNKNFQNKTMAKFDEKSVLQGANPRLIDEWQEVPSLWDAVRFASDIDNAKGRFLLTGSATPVHKGILHSGAGRISTLRMTTMSLFETGDSDGGVSLEKLFEKKLELYQSQSINLDQLIYLTIRGGWPNNIGLDEKSCLDFSKSYLKSVIEDDIYRIDEIRRDQNKIRFLVKSLALNISTTVSNRKLMNEVKEFGGVSMANDTLNEYLDILKRLFIIEEQPSFSSNLRSSTKIGKKPKRHFADPSLAIAALGLTKDQLKNDLNTFGFIFESLCYHDMKIYAESIGASIYHYRDKLNREIDIVIQLSDGRWGAFEVTLGNSQIDKAAESLIKIRKVFENDSKATTPSILVIISGQANIAYTRKDGVMVVPIYALKN